MLATFWPTLANTGKQMTHIDKDWSKVPKFSSTLAKFGQCRPMSTEFVRVLAKVEQVWPTLVNGWSASADVGRIWTVSQLPTQLLDKCWTTFRELLGGVGARRDRRRYFSETCGEQQFRNFRR